MIGASRPALRLCCFAALSMSRHLGVSALSSSARATSPPSISVAPMLVVTGGPCSGKTRAIEALPASMGGVALLRVPEAATLYFEQGGRLPFGAPVDASGRRTAAEVFPSHPLPPPRCAPSRPPQAAVPPPIKSVAANGCRAR